MMGGTPEHQTSPMQSRKAVIVQLTANMPLQRGGTNVTPRGERSRSCDRREEDEKRLQPAKTAAADSGHFSSQVRFSPRHGWKWSTCDRKGLNYAGIDKIKQDIWSV